MDILKELGIIGDDFTDIIETQYNGSRNSMSLWDIAVGFEDDDLDWKDGDLYD